MAIRTFVALALPDDLLDELVLAQQQVVAVLGDDRVRAIAREQLHVTLAFLAHREDDELPAIERLVDDHVAGWRPVSLRLGPLRTFGFGNVLGFDLHGDDVEQLAAWQQPLATALVAAGLMPDERRRWRPHVSIARSRGRRGPKLRPPAGVGSDASFACDRVQVFASVPAGRGHEYQVMHERVLSQP